MAKCTLVGIPLNEVGDRLTALSESLEQNNMALKADTGVHISCCREGEALSLVLEVYLFREELEEKENG
ncbi:MAG: hypothetical protein IKB72_05580 [Ruminococcus sp.]|nr:hypothetical protein [Ruminococcus sp.]